MKLRVFLPASDRIDAATVMAWRLFDARHESLRQGESPLDAMPGASNVEVIVPAERVLFARLRLPRVNAATIRELLPFAVEDRLLADPAHIHAVAGRTDPRGETIVAVVDRDWLSGAIDTLARAGLRPARAWPEGALVAGGQDDWHVAWGASRGLLVDDAGVGTTFDHDASGAFPLAIRIALDEAATRGERPRLVRVHRAGAALPDLGRWSQEAGVAFQAGDEWNVVAASAAPAHAIDLLRGFTRASRRGFALPRAAPALAALLVVLQLGFTAFDTYRLAREKAALQAKQEEIFRATFPDAKVVVDPDLQMARNRAELERSRGIASGDEFLARLTEAGRGSNAPVKALRYADGKLEVQR